MKNKFKKRKCRKTKHKITRNLQINIEKKWHLVYSKLKFRENKIEILNKRLLIKRKDDRKC